MHKHKFHRLNDRQIFCEVDGEVRTIGYAPYQTVGQYQTTRQWVIWPYPYIQWGNGTYWTADTATTTNIWSTNTGGTFSAEGRQVSAPAEGQKDHND